MSAPARTIRDLPTPALLLDLDVLERNLHRMQERADALGVRLRPHIKTHKCVEVARRQAELGATGLTVSTLEEAKVLAEHGFEDLTWAFPLVLSRLSEALELSERVRLGVTVDGEEAIEALERSGRPLRVWLEVDCGYGRTGVDPAGERVVSLARRLGGSRTLRLAGLLTHSGQAYHADSERRIEAIAEEERRTMTELAERLRGEGIDPGELSVGSTPAMSLARDLGGIDEARPGNYALYDYTQARLGSCAVEDCAATVLATVISSRPDRGRSVVDAGALALSKDLGPDEPGHYGRLRSDPEEPALDPDGRVLSVSQEHGILSRALPVGARVRIVPNHSCLTVACHDAFVLVRGTEVRGIWKIWRDR